MTVVNDCVVELASDRGWQCVVELANDNEWPYVVE